MLTHIAWCAGAVLFKQKLSQIATLYRDAKGSFEAKVNTSATFGTCKNMLTRLRSVLQRNMDMNMDC